MFKMHITIPDVGQVSHCGIFVHFNFKCIVAFNNNFNMFESYLFSKGPVIWH